MTTALKSNRPLTTTNSPVNSFVFAVQSLIKGQVNTAIPVQVISVDSGGAGAVAGRVSVRPLICQTDAYGETLDPVELFELPYSRIQGGVAALVIDPMPGDIGLAVFAQQDSSNVTAGTSEPVPPGSFRYFDMADGFYIGGFLNQAPSVYVEITQDGNVNVTAPTKVTVTTPEAEFTGNVHIAGDVTIGGDLDVNGRITADGGYTSISGNDITAGSISVRYHTHTCPDGTTGPAQ